MLHVMTPYPIDEETTAWEYNYNYLHSASQMVVECALGLLKNWFQIFLKPLNMGARSYMGIKISATTASALVVEGCMRLHNALIDLNDTAEPVPEINKNNDNTNTDNTNNNAEVVLGQEAILRRNRIRDWLAEEHNL